MGDNDPIDACEIGTMVSSSLINLFFIYYFYLFIYFQFVGKQGHAWGRHGVVPSAKVSVLHATPTLSLHSLAWKMPLPCLLVY